MENEANILTLEVEVTDIIYQNESNGYTVFEFETDDLLETATGIIPALYVGERLKISGEWTKHPTYGEQFRIISFEKEAPSDSLSILKYLSSGSIKGIGPKTAERIVEKFGDDTFSVLESSPELLSTIKGISKARAREISVNFNSQFGMRNVIMFFSEHFGPTLTTKIYKRWGSASIDIVKNNPYVLCSSINGIGFEKADTVARSVGFPNDSSERIEAGIIYILKQDSAVSGNMYLPKSKLIRIASGLLAVEEKRVEDSVCSMCARKLLISFDFDTMTPDVMGENASIYLPVNFQIEKSIAEKLTLLSRFNASDFLTDINSIIASVEESEGIKYEPLQKNAIISALQNSLYILTGGPGTGKTTIIRAIISIFTNMGLKYFLAAPTGRAAKRMSESTQKEAKTIHRLLEYEFTDNDDEISFTRDESNPLECDVVIIDEVSMVDSMLFLSLLRAIRPGTRLILIGDASQLPSVGAGNVLGDIISSGVFEVGKLNKIFRQENDSSIIVNAHKINNGQYPDLDNKSSDFFFMSRDSASSVAKTIAELYDKRLPRKYGEEILSQIQVLSPTRKSECGTGALNNLLQEIINPPSDKKVQIKLKDFIIREGDKVMQTKNNYDISWKKDGFWGEEENGVGVFNGDIGTIIKINTVDESVTVDFDSKLVEYDFHSLEDVELAYAITIHKSQGSEYPVVIVPVLSVSSMLMTRNLIYTAITRAQKMVILVGSKSTVYKMVDNDTHTQRFTGLERFLKV